MNENEFDFIKEKVSHAFNKNVKLEQTYNKLIEEYQEIEGKAK